MENLKSVRDKINQMAETALSMLKSTYDGFMKHDAGILAEVLENEQKLNALEEAATKSLAEISKTKISAAEKKNIMLLANVAADLEEIGDYIKDMVERIEIKIEERLLFSDDAVDEYKHLYNAVETELADVQRALAMNDSNFAKRILCGEENHADKLVQKYRKSHAKRLVEGVCLPRACNMFLNLLDFTAQISHHARAIAGNIIALK